MAQTANQSLTHTRGDTFSRTLTFSQAVSSFSEIWFTVRNAWATTETDDSDVVTQITKTDGDITNSGARTVTVVVEPSLTSQWTSDVYVYDVQVKTSADEIFTVVRGQLRVAPHATVSTT